MRSRDNAATPRLDQRRRRRAAREGKRWHYVPVPITAWEIERLTDRETDEPREEKGDDGPE